MEKSCSGTLPRQGLKKIIYHYSHTDIGSVVLGKQWLHPEMTEKLLTGIVNQYTSEAVAEEVLTGALN